MGIPNKKRDDAWAEAKRRCRLNENDIMMAKKMGLTPQTLIKNIPSKTERWKAPVKQWIHELYADKYGNVPGDKSKDDSLPF